MKSLKNKIEELNLSYQKEILKFAIFNILIIALLIVSLFLIKNILVIVSIVFLLAIGNYFMINRYSQIEIKRKRDIDNEFIELFSYLRIYLYNNETVYQSFKNILVFASPKMNTYLKNLISEIDEDKTIAPFIKFASNFQNKVIEEVMISLFEIVDSGKSDLYLNQFNKIFENLKNRVENEASEKRLKYFDSLNLYSVVGSGIIMITLSFAIVSLLGGLING